MIDQPTSNKHILYHLHKRYFIPSYEPILRENGNMFQKSKYNLFTSIVEPVYLPLVKDKIHWINSFIQVIGIGVKFISDEHFK